MSRINSIRQHFANEIRHRANVTSTRLLRSFAAVPREAFLDEGPWRVRSDLVPTYWTTDSADPAHVYHDVLIAIDEARCLDNGLPSLWAYLFDVLAIQEGEHIVHVGCGTGYYSAILADAVGPSGHVTAIEYDSELAHRAAINLKDRPTIDVVQGDGCQHDSGVAQVIIVNAGASSPAPLWLDSLDLNGRLLLPLTIENRRGPLLLIKRLVHGYDVQTLRGIEIFPCHGGRSLETEAQLQAALWEGETSNIRSLRRDRHQADESCWLHGKDYCLSKKILSSTAL